MEHDGEASRVAGRGPELSDSTLSGLAPARPASMWAALLAFVPLSLLGGFFPAFSLSASLYVLVLGGALLVVGLNSRAQLRQAGTELPPGVVWWLLPVGLLVLVEGITYALGSTHDYPTLSLLADPLLDGYFVRCLTYFGWLTVFWRLIRR